VVIWIVIWIQDRIFGFFAIARMGRMFISGIAQKVTDREIWLKFSGKGRLGPTCS